MAKQKEFRQVAESRYLARMAGTAGIGSEMDQRFDAIFAEFIDETDHVETQLLKSMSDDLKSYHSMQWGMIAALAILTVAMGAVLHVFIRRRALDLAAIREREENLSITMNSIGDAVIATDEKGRLTRMNPVAEALTGWSAEEARGRALVEVFRIINSKTRAQAENPVEKVLRDGKIVGLANHTALVARDGVERQIADSGAPIRGQDGAIVGVVLVFRDVSEQYAHQEEVAGLRNMLTNIIDSMPLGTRWRGYGRTGHAVESPGAARYRRRTRGGLRPSGW